MKSHIIWKKRLLASLVSLFIILSLAACGGSDPAIPSPEGSFKCTEADQGSGEGIQPVDPEGDPEILTFNPDGSGTWEYELQSPITWEVKGNTITIYEEIDGEEHSYKGSWDGDKITLNVMGYEYIYEK